MIDALGRAGTSDITVLNRSPDAAERAAQLAAAASVGIVSDVTRADIVVNATSVGMGVVPTGAGVDDLPCDPPCCTTSRSSSTSCTTRCAPPGSPPPTRWVPAPSTGSGCSIHQAALQQQRWSAFPTWP